MPYIKKGEVADDPYVRLGGDEPVPTDVPAIVSLEWLLAQAPQSLDSRNVPLGVALPNDKAESLLEPYLPRLSLVALDFPIYRDGRAFTQARRLREAYGFTGEIRASGDVLRDQFLFMVRSGFDAFEVRKDHDAKAFAKALREFSGFYQPSLARDGGFRFRFSPPFSTASKEGESDG
ncbi:DUF934 domain-containing protein [Rhodomicrobium sp. Az07]|uniref:DUF934 domain-containing protein n=1 Tax=Rhodomicrobium sp. Az07 TaxID=2839034 RepID=UPI001BE54B56|nr:DUF934 domain-containing protein [Rhodomicrobium sp. Az07]MBT3069745.1 DUF934 domain-containing protein [Rhodomicrobium sp. Az07]